MAHPQAFLLLRREGHLHELVTPPGSVDHRSSKSRSSFLSSGYEGKVALLQELDPALGSEQIHCTLESAQVYFIEVCVLSICNLFSHMRFIITISFLDCRVWLVLSLSFVRLFLSMSPRLILTRLGNRKGTIRNK